MTILQSRRRFVVNAAVAGVAGFGALGVAGLGGNRTLAAEPPPEVTTIRFEKDPVACVAPPIADELLRAEGFTDIRYVELTEAHVRNAEAANVSSIDEMIVSGDVDFARDFVPSHIASMEAGRPITVIAGLHSACFEVLGRDDIRSIADLKGRTVGNANGSGDERLLKIMASLVGLDSAKDIRWVTSASQGPLDLFIEGKIDAFVAQPPVLQDVRARNIGHVIASSITDRPWSEYFCCMMATSTEFAQKYPIATRRALRAILKAADLCTSQPELMAQSLVKNGYTTRVDYARQALGEIRYDVWRDYDPDDSLRFYALRMYEAGLIKSDPQKLIADHTDWRFFDKIKRELKV
jgi:NitT/TauT family transport system substrate-binding protein